MFILRRLTITWLFLLMALFFVACGPQPLDEVLAIQGVVSPTEVNSADLTTEVPPSTATTEADKVEPTTNSEKVENRPNIVVQAGSQMTNAEGIEVGFTESGHPYIGNINAPIVIEEYSDYQCPFCERFYKQTMPALIEDQVKNGEAVVIFKDFPLDFHPQADDAAVAARCAGAQSATAYWQMHDTLFNNFGNWAIEEPKPLFIGYAEELGLDSAEFSQCLTDNPYSQAIQADLQAGSEVGVSGTPSFIINGQLFVGAQPKEAFDQAIVRAKAGEPIVEAPKPVEVEEPTAVELSEQVAATMGDPNAKVVLVEFTDYQCPFCARHSVQTQPQLLKEWVETGRVYYILKDLPLDQIHPVARRAHVAARCAGEQEKYWEMHDKLFAAQAEWSQSADPDATIIAWSDLLQLDQTTFSQCMASGKFDALIEENVQEAFKIGINGTPTFVVQGYPVISGAQSLDVFKQVFELAESDGLVDAIMDARRQQLQAQQQQEAQPEPTAVPIPDDFPLGDAFILGHANAPVTIVEYTDYQCPFCQRYYQETFSQIKANFIDTGMVRYVFKDFPLTQIHPQAVAASVSAHCAREQDRFLEMHGLLFDTQKEWSGIDPTEKFVELAQGLGIDTEAFRSCLSQNNYASAIDADMQEGVGFGVRGTPAFFINGTFLSGAQPYQVFQQAIEQAAQQ